MEKEGALTPSSTVALIYRTNAQSRALEEACVAGNLRHVLRGKAGSFYSRAEIRDCICFLKWLYNGRDEGAMRRAIKTPTRGIGDVSVGEFLEYCNVVERNRLEKTEGADADAAASTARKRLTYLDILVSLSQQGEGGEKGHSLAADLPPPEVVMSKRTLNRLLPFSSQMQMLRTRAKIETVPDLLSSIIEIVGLRAHVDSMSKTRDEFEDRWGNVVELCSAAGRYSEDGPCLSSRQEVDIDGKVQVLEGDCSDHSWHGQA
jgi:superfamily I DNA/RNA helicase